MELARLTLLQDKSLEMGLISSGLYLHVAGKYEDLTASKSSTGSKAGNCSRIGKLLYLIFCSGGDAISSFSTLRVLL